MEGYPCSMSRQAISRHTCRLVCEQVILKDVVPKCPAARLAQLLILAASRLVSLSQACSMTVRSCCYESARKALAGNLTLREELERRLNRALAATVPRGFSRRTHRLAIDLTLVPYHGEPLLEANELVRGKRKSGTTYFHAYATLYIISRGERFTVAMTYVLGDDPLPLVIRRLLRQSAKIGIKPRVLLLDRGFWSVDVISYLKVARVPFVMPVIARGRKPNHPRGPSGTWVFFTARRSRFDEHTLINHDGRHRARVRICVRWLKDKKCVLVYAFWGLSPGSCVWVQQLYRKRFGIESSYRQMNQSRVRTTSRCPRVRLLLIGLSLLLRNVWVWLHYECLSTPRRGKREFHEERLYYQQFLACLQTTIIDLIEPLDHIPIGRPIPKPLRDL